MNDTFAMVELELCKLQTLAHCLDDAITGAVNHNSSEAGERAVCLVDLLQEHIDKLAADVEYSGEGTE